MHQKRSYRQDVLNKLEARYSGLAGSRSLKLRMAWKRTAWYLGLGVARVLKRTLDIFVASLALLVLCPVFLLLGLTIWLYDRGPVFFVQKRVGQWGAEFDCPKFRSMVCDAEARKCSLLSLNQHKNGITFKIRNDPRITPIGRFIRKTSLDELPQLWTILMGDMSLVGPRPPLPQEVLKYSLAQRRRLDAKPGLTCFWQVEGRGDVPFSRQVEMDLRYIDSQNMWLDLWLIMKTIPAVVLGRGAY